MSPKRLVLLVEGQGDVEAAPILVGRLLNEYSAFDAVFLDPHPFRIGEYSKISKNDFGEWRRYVQAAAKRPDFGGCVLLLDGDSSTKVDGQPFCAMRAAQRLAAEAQKVGAGHQFSVAIVFACMEFESWLIAGVESLVDKLLYRPPKGVADRHQPDSPRSGIGSQRCKRMVSEDHGNRVQTGSRPGRFDSTGRSERHSKPPEDAIISADGGGNSRSDRGSSLR